MCASDEAAWAAMLLRCGRLLLALLGLLNRAEELLLLSKLASASAA
jgi:hypothetical protein